MYNPQGIATQFAGFALLVESSVKLVDMSPHVQWVYYYILIRLISSDVSLYINW